MSRVRRLFVLLAIVTVLMAQSSAALAAPAGWKLIDVTLHADQQQSLLLVAGELPESAKLPFETEIAVPAGTQVQWVGEILGGDPANDPQLEYTKSSADGVDIYRFTLTKSRIAQVEGILPGITGFDGTNYVTNMKWTAWQDVPEVRMSQRIPQAAQIVQAAQGASVYPAGTSNSYYSKTVSGAKAGDVIDLSFSYKLPAAGAATAGGAKSSNSLVPVLVIGAAIVGFGLLFYNANRKSAAQAAYESTDEGAGYEEYDAEEYDAEEYDEDADQERYDQAGSEDDESEGTETYDQDDAEAEYYDEEYVDGEPAQGTRQGGMKPIMPMLLVAGAIVVGFIFASSQGTSASVADGKISRDFGSPSACQSTSIPFTTTEGVDLAKQGDQILKGFEGMEGVGVVTIDIAQSKVDLSWCVSSQSEESMRQVLSSTGLITLGSPASPAPGASPTGAAPTQ